MQHENADELVLRMYRTTVALANGLNRGGNLILSDRSVANSLMKMHSMLPLLDRELREEPMGDPGRAEGYLKGILELRGSLGGMERSSTIDDTLRLADEAEALALEAINALRGDALGRDEREQGKPQRSAGQIVDELRAAIVGSNELTDEQRKDALGYIGALYSILAMAKPDRLAFDAIAGRLLKFGETLGNVLVMETVKELVKWGLRNLL